MDPSIAKDWHVWSMVLGRTLKPAMDELARRVPNLHSAMVCTSDGFNLCALNIAEDKVARMAALSSSLFALGSASGGGGRPQRGRTHRCAHHGTRQASLGTGGGGSNR